MKSLFNAADNDEIISRINRLTTGVKAEWGKMNVSQMLAHVQAPLRVAVGDVVSKRSIVGILFGRLALKKLLSEKPWSRGMPTDKTFIVSDQRNFGEEKKKLLALIERFVRLGPNGISKEKHPFFGKLTPDEWGGLMWNHLNHHLKQFGS